MKHKGSVVCANISSVLHPLSVHRHLRLIKVACNVEIRIILTFLLNSMLYSVTKSVQI